MTFDARAEADKAAETYEPFRFLDLDGIERQLPHPYTMAADDVLKLTEATRREDDSVVFELFDRLAPESADAMRAMPSIVVGRLLEAWQHEIGEAGKSESPRSTTNRAARRSKPTSKSSG